MTSLTLLRGVAFGSIGELFELTRKSLELRPLFWSSDRVGYRAHACGVNAVLIDPVRGLVRILCHGSLIPSSASLFRTRITCVAYHLPPSGVGMPRPFNVWAALRADRSCSSAKTLRSCSARSRACRWYSRLLDVMPPSTTPRALAALRATLVPLADHAPFLF